MVERNLFKLIPKVDDILGRDNIKKILETIPRNVVLDSIREETKLIREKIKNNKQEEEILEVINNLELSIISNAEYKNSYKLRRVINATGVVVHTNLGRSVINEKIIDRKSVV